MERKQSRLQAVMAAIGLLILILDSRKALDGARSGVELCINTVIPALFPFFVLSIILTNTLNDSATYSAQLLNRFFGIPQVAASVLVPSFLGGYPVGAKCVGDLYRRKQIDRQNAEWLLAFCSNAGPSFLFGMLSGFFPERKMVWMLWLIHIFSATLTAFVLPSPKTEGSVVNQECPEKTHAVILPAAKTMAVVCCWVILFRMIITFLDSWILWLFPGWVQVLVMGILELTNGCCELFLVTDIRLRFVLCACMLAFGGICVLFQTASVINRLSIVCYLKGKILQTAFSFLLSYAVVSERRLSIAVLVPILVMILRQTIKRCRNSQMIPV